MSTESAFLEAICAEPDEDVHRLVYADWLDEHGHCARAELIRVQVEMASVGKVMGSLRSATSDEWRLAAEKDDERFLVLQCRGRELLQLDEPFTPRNQPRPEWAPEALRQSLPWDEGGWVWRRGFIEQVSVRLSCWIAFGPQMARAAPLREVHLTDREPAHITRNRWMWLDARLGEPAGAACTVPSSLGPVYDRLHVQNRKWRHKTRKDALKALSHTCLTWAREQPLS